ncbi:carbamoyltransferase C-terminal domain-containing protein [Nocardia sp. NPDC049220]|uniref:carbamoyltransferase family protein n=1 Tax=Nocardia sp. NPDC049220 TaxID=3155273 RepID=UPI0033D2A824
MFVLGIHGTFGRADHDAAAVLLRDGEIVAAAEEERFIRYKHAVGLMPDHAIRFVLAAAAITIHDVDVIAFPRATWRGFEPRFEAYLWYQFGHVPPVEYIDHHLAHAASAYLLSGFDRSLIVTADQAGDGICCAVFRGEGATITPVETIGWPDSIGLYAAAMTQYLGGRSNHDEYKVMGLAAHGTPDPAYTALLRADAGRPHLDTSWIHAEVFHRHPLFHTDQLPMTNADQLLGLPPRRLPGAGLRREDADLAASVQAAIEDTFTALVDRHRNAADTRLCVAGGVAENSVMAGRLATSARFTDLYAAPACGDAGTALGAALVVAAGHGHRPSRLTHTQFGPSWTDQQIAATLTDCGAQFTTTDDPAAAAADLLARQHIVAWFQGRMEFGPRALGARSLLADPSTVEMQRRVNSIKRREQFRPFGPSVLTEHLPALFGREVTAPFMSFTLPTAAPTPIVAAIHVDGSSRPHTVDAGTGVYRRLIEQFHQLTGIPAVLNTSLNSGWEPIIASPEQALAFLFSSPADALVIGCHVVTKPGRP